MDMKNRLLRFFLTVLFLSLFAAISLGCTKDKGKPAALPPKETETTEAVETEAEEPPEEELLPDILSVRELKFDEIPVFSEQYQVAEYALHCFMWGRYGFECYFERELAPDADTARAVLYKACQAMAVYHLFGAYNEQEVQAEDRGDGRIYVSLKLSPQNLGYDLEARAQAREYVKQNPVPEGGFENPEAEKEYLRGIHDFIALKVSYSPLGYTPDVLAGKDNYTAMQEAYTCLGEGQDFTLCAGYSRAFALIAHYAGINVAWVGGSAGDIEHHAWNIVYPCDGSEPVLVDVTWDDTLSQDGNGQTEVDQRWFYIPLSRDPDHRIDPHMAGFLEYLNS